MFMGLLRSWRSTFKTACLCVFGRFLLKATNSRKSSHCFLWILYRRPDWLHLYSAQDNLAGRHTSATGIPMPPYRATAPFLIKVIQWCTCRGETNPWQPDSPGISYHQSLSPMFFKKTSVSDGHIVRWNPESQTSVGKCFSVISNR